MAMLLGLMVVIVVWVIIIGILFLATLLGSITNHPYFRPISSNPVGDVEVNLVEEKNWDGEQAPATP